LGALTHPALSASSPTCSPRRGGRKRATLAGQGTYNRSRESAFLIRSEDRGRCVFLSLNRTRPDSAEPIGLHRYCTGCSRETEHLSWATGGPAKTPAIFRPVGVVVSGTTICLDCGEPRAAGGHARALARA
jgi:hypothetical protein